MSNTVVGQIYSKIMDEVIENCVVTFEEDGVERRLLDEVRQTWQSKLSERRVAQMPWDPTPGPGGSASAPSAASTQASSMPSQASQPDTKPPTQMSTQSSAPSDPAIKSEPGTGGYDLQNLHQANGTAAYANNGAALDRTSQQLHEKFGASAAPQINQLQQRRQQIAGQSQQSQPQQGANSQAALEAKRREYELQQAQRHKASLAAQQQQQQALRNSQTDGASEWEEFVAARRAQAATNGTAADNSLRAMLEASSMEMEGGGLLGPLNKRPARPSAARRARLAGPSSSHAQFDGADDEDDKDGIKDDEDEDAINSDLDDSEDELDKEETDEDANQGEIMLCTYDKVQRVKNKWKCTLKDGVLTTGGKEYVFHKANGDFEW